MDKGGGWKMPLGGGGSRGFWRCGLTNSIILSNIANRKNTCSHYFVRMDTIQLIEIIAATIGIIYVWLEIRAHIWLWPVGVILPFFYIYISYESKMYGNIFVNVYYIIAAIWGWIEWHRRGADTEESHHIAYASGRTRAILLGIGVLGSFVMTMVFRYMVSDSAYPIGDAVATVTAFVGMWLLAKKYIENWYCWIASNTIFCVLFALQGFYVTCGFFALYTIMAVVGLVHWRRLMSRQV